MATTTAIQSAIFSSKVLWSIWGLALFVWLGMTAVLLYHWNTYAKGDKRVRRMKYAYFIGSVCALLLALSFVFSL